MTETLNYLRMTGRTEQEVQLVERYYKEQGLFRTDDARPIYTKIVGLDLGTVETSVAGPKRPQDRVPLSQVKESFRKCLVAPIAERGFALDEKALARTEKVIDNGRTTDIGHGAVVIASITSCTNTSNPSVMLAAGLLAKAAVEKGLQPQAVREDEPWSRLARGGRLFRAGRADEAAGAAWLSHRRLRLHHLHRQQRPVARCGRQCRVRRAISWRRPCSAAIAISRAESIRWSRRIIWPVRRWSWPMPWPGRMDIDLATEPLGTGTDGKPVYLRDIWPSPAVINKTMDEVGASGDVSLALCQRLAEQSEVE